VPSLPKSSAADNEAFEMMQARLRYFSHGGVPSLLVTSCVPKEGKTTVAWHLAQTTAASSPGRVLVIETDLRRPTLATTFGMSEAPGLTEVLTNQCDFVDAVRAVEVPTVADKRSMDVMLAGRVPPNPAELIESPEMADVIQRATHAYDFVVIDSGPALVVPDVLSLMTRVSGVLIVSHLGSTTRLAASQLRQQLDAVDAPVVGVVANRVKEPLRSGYYSTNDSQVESR
jgi:capsular exopolysaccharide synthesis family protein